MWTSIARNDSNNVRIGLDMMSQHTDMRMKGCRDPGSNPRISASLQDLSDALLLEQEILPRIQLLEGTTRLLLVTPAALEGVSLSALPVAHRSGGRQGEQVTGTLGSQFDRGVATVPSLGFACVCRALQDKQRLQRADSGEVAGTYGGKSKGVRCAWRVVSVGAPRAIFARWEAKRVLQTFVDFGAGGQLLTGGEAVLDDIQWAARPGRCDVTGKWSEAKAGGGQTWSSSVVHFACHGRPVVDEEGVERNEGEAKRRRGLLLADNEMLRTEDVRQWDLSRCALVAMSVCSSALEAFRLPRAFVHAGCPCVVCW